MTGHLAMAAGSAAAPSLTQSADNTTGISFPSYAEIVASLGGNQILAITTTSGNANGEVVFGGGSSSVGTGETVGVNVTPNATTQAVGLRTIINQANNTAQSANNFGTYTEYSRTITTSQTDTGGGVAVRADIKANVATGQLLTSSEIDVFDSEGFSNAGAGTWTSSIFNQYKAVANSTVVSGSKNAFWAGGQTGGTYNYSFHGSAGIASFEDTTDALSSTSAAVETLGGLAVAKSAIIGTSLTAATVNVTGLTVSLPVYTDAAHNLVSHAFVAPTFTNLSVPVNTQAVLIAYTGT